MRQQVVWWSWAPAHDVEPEELPSWGEIFRGLMRLLRERIGR